MKKIIIPFVASAFLAACTSDDLGQMVQGDKFGGQVTLTSDPYTFEDGATRTALTNTGSSISFAWKDGEAIGIFPVAPTTNNQAKQVLSVSSEATNASFDGAGWALMKGNTYAAYSPFVKEMATYDAVPVSMTGQTQDGSGSLAHIGNKYDYMYATASVPSNGNVNFAFNHVASIIMLELTMPKAGKWKEVSLTSADKVFTTSATMDVSTGAVTPVSKSNTISLALKNIETKSSNQKITLYMSVLPCTTGELTLNVKEALGSVVSHIAYTATLPTKTLEAGKAYKWVPTLSVHGDDTPLFPVEDDPVVVPTIDNSLPSSAAAVDLGLSVKWANMNVGATSATDYGTYFAWGEVTGCQRKSSDGSCIAATMDGYPSSWTGSKNSNYVSGKTKSIYIWSYYKWGNSESNFYKYVASSSRGTVDNRKTLESSDDAAIVNWGGDWRMPTHAEQDELYNNCYWVWTDSYNGSGINGYIVYKAKNTSDKGKVMSAGTFLLTNYSLKDSHIFLPCASYRSSGSFCDVGGYGGCWSSSLNEGSSGGAFGLSFLSSDVSWGSYCRYYGFSVRAVCQ